MSPESTEQQTNSGHDQVQVPCRLCGRVRPPEALEWWCDTTPYGEPLAEPLLVCRDAVTCLRLMRTRYEAGRL